MADWSTRNARTLLNVLQAGGQARDLRILSFRDHSLRGEIFSPSEDLSGADLRDADLGDAQLSGVRLLEASLADARLEAARLDGANLRGADLSNAALDRASLVGADLTGCKLDGTSWRRARLIGAQVDLTSVPAERLLGAALPDAVPRLCVSGPTTSCAFALSSNLLLLATFADAGIQLWDLTTERRLALLPIASEQVETIAFGDLPDGRAILAGGGADGAVRIWDPTTGERLHTLVGAGGKAPVLAFAQLAGGRAILATGGGSRDESHDPALGVIHIWDPLAGERLNTIVLPGSEILSLALGTRRHGDPILASNSCEKGSNVYSTSGFIHTWDPTTGASLSTIEGDHDNGTSMAFGTLQDGSTILVTAGGSFHNKVILWDPLTGHRLDSLHEGEEGYEGPGVVTFVQLPDGRTVLASAITQADVHLWDPTTKETLSVFSGEDSDNFILELAAAPLPDGRTILVSGNLDDGFDEHIEIWNTGTGHPRPLSDGHGWVGAVAFAQLPDGRTILASAGKDGPIHLWDAATGEHLRVLVGHEDRAVRVASARLSDGRTVLASTSESYRHTPSRASMYMWDLATGERLSNITDSRRRAWTMSLAELADGRAILVTGGGYLDHDSNTMHNAIHIRDPATDEQLSSLTGDDAQAGTTALTQLPDGRAVLATGTSRYDRKRNSRYGVIHIWDPLTGEHLNEIVDHNDTISALAFARLSDGRTVLASCGGSAFEGGDGRVHLWDPLTGEKLHAFSDDINSLQTISCGRLVNGHAILAIGGGDTVRVWDLDAASTPLSPQGSPPKVAPSLICTRRFGVQIAALAWNPESSMLATGLANQCVALSRFDGTSLREHATLMMMPEGHATLYPDGSYRLVGDPDGRFWWSAGLCRFEPGELDGYAGIRRVD